jgi:hypothetical protein
MTPEKMTPYLKNKDESHFFSEAIPSETGECTLFICGHSEITSTTTLYTYGVYPSITGELTLYEYGHGKEDSNLNLFCQAAPINSVAGSTTLFINGKATSIDDKFASIDLYINAEIYNKKLNLYISGVDTGSVTKSMNLFISGTVYNIASTITLFCANNEEPAWLSAPAIFLQKFLPALKNHNDVHEIVYGQISNTLNLFLRRNPAEMITLFLKAQPESVNNEIPLFIKGAYPVNNSMNLVMPYTKQGMANSINLYTHGY